MAKQGKKPFFKRKWVMYRELNEEGREKVLSYTKDLVDTGNYKKGSPVRVDTKEA